MMRNRIMISSLCLSMISAQTLRVCREGKPVPTFPDHALVFFDPYHLRPAADHLVALNGLQRAIDRVLAGRIGNQNDRHRRSFLRCAVLVNAVGMALHDRFNGNFLLGQPGGDGGGGAGAAIRGCAGWFGATARNPASPSSTPPPELR